MGCFASSLSVRKKSIPGLVVLALVGGLGWWLFLRAEPLPRMRLADGGEFRVLKVVYGADEDLSLHGAPKWLFKLWRLQPEAMQRIVPYPWRGNPESVPMGG